MSNTPQKFAGCPRFYPTENTFGGDPEIYPTENSFGGDPVCACGCVSAKEKCKTFTCSAFSHSARKLSAVHSFPFCGVGGLRRLFLARHHEQHPAKICGVSAFLPHRKYFRRGPRDLPHRKFFRRGPRMCLRLCFRKRKMQDVHLLRVFSLCSKTIRRSLISLLRGGRLTPPFSTKMSGFCVVARTGFSPFADAIFSPTRKIKDFSRGDPEAPCVNSARRTDGARCAIPSLRSLQIRLAAPHSRKAS